MPTFRLPNSNTLLPKISGFTLLELLVVIVVISIATGLIVVQGIPSNTQYIRTEAKKLSQILWIAQQEAKLTNTTLRVVKTTKGYEFLHQINDGWVTYNKEKHLRPRNWETESLVVNFTEDNQHVLFLEITPRTHLRKQQITMNLKEARLILERTFTGRFQIIDEKSDQSKVL